MNSAIKNIFYSNGNLIITAEYFVLVGAKALAVPLNHGQYMRVECFKNYKNTLQWEAFEQGKQWFNADFDCDKINIISSNDIEKALSLQKILKGILKIKPELIEENKSYHITCDIQFNTNWGWGSSSTLISNLANWAGVDPFELNELKSPAGSGYDIAASGAPGPIFYQLNNYNRHIIPIVFDPVFKENIYFIYLGKKQNSSKSIESKFKSVTKNNMMIPIITGLTEKIAGENNMNEFMRLIVEHEKILSMTLNLTRIKKAYFNDFEGELKSLGAWGGDTAMVISPMTEEYVKRYFNDKGLESVFRFEEIVKN